jgi:uncharacterized OsmC-like protein
LWSEVEGEVEKEEGVLVIRRIRVAYHLVADESARETVERVHEVHHDSCPVYRTLHRCIEVSTRWVLEEG